MTLQKIRKIIYLVTTLIIAFVFFIGGIADILQPADAVEVIRSLGYPIYLMPFLGVLKIAGAIALLVKVKQFPIREWAYAGITFDLLGACYSHLRVSGFNMDVIIILVFLVILAGSYTHQKYAK